MFSLLPLSVLANTHLILSTDQKFLIEYYDSAIVCHWNIFCTKYIEQAEVMSKVYVGIMRPAQVTLAAAI